MRISHHLKVPILGCGAEQKTTFCLAKGNYAFLSSTFGDLEDQKTLQSFEEEIEHFKKVLRIEPEAIAYDLHPEYLSTKYALNLASNIYHLYPIQHHHAHIASCLAENGLKGKVIGVAFDGTGLGEDGCLWGGEFLIAGYSSYQRKAHLMYVPLVSGAKAIKEPWRMACVWLQEAFGEDFLNLNLAFNRRMDKNKWTILKEMIRDGINSPLTSSVGRLFDAVSSLINIRDVIDYEAQAAIELEKAIGSNCRKVQSPQAKYRYEINNEEGVFIIDPRPTIRGAAEDLMKGVQPSFISLKFHNTIVDMIAKTCLIIGEEMGLKQVALSGGVFQNRFLAKEVPQALKALGFEVLVHNKVTCGDGGISLGQAVIANAKYKR